MKNKSDLLALKGVGEKKAGLLKKLGIDSIDALLRFYPRTYNDYSIVTPIADTLSENTYTVRAKLSSAVQSKDLYNKPIVRYFFKVEDSSGEISVEIYQRKNTPFMLKGGIYYYFHGKITGNFIDKGMSSPTILFENSPKIEPVYPLTSGITSKELNKIIITALNEHMPKDGLREDIRKKYNLCDLDYALKNIHSPLSLSAMETAKKRLVFEELLVLQTAMALTKNVCGCAKGIKIEKDFSEEFLKALPFSATNAQKRVIKECMTDITDGKQLNRLVQGDVGSGKTAVAATLCYTFAKNNYQSAVMVPTEILAEQHFATFSAFFKNSNIKCSLLTSSLQLKEKRKIKEQLKKGEIDVIIGTHALITDNVEFSNLALVITDEQHRFGVAQRSSLTDKGENPHRLVMSATPIPRTLAMIVYGDLDISIIDEYPKNRRTVDSYCVTPSKRQRVYDFLKKHIEEGQQCYIVCPAIEEGKSGLVSAEEYYASLVQKEFSSYKIGLLHGKMKASEKEEIMLSFKNGDIDLLVCTTVIEVGIDVPKATVMVIENAERFGLSQLHQLRGRIGRSNLKSTCIFISESKNNKRLQIMCSTTDGFKIADQDLKLRGPGDFIGQRQHGLPQLKIAHLSNDSEILYLSGICSKEILKDDRTLTKEINKDLLITVNTLLKDTDI